jgi:hypothetical protein
VVAATIAGSVGDVVEAWDSASAELAEPLDAEFEYAPAPDDGGTEIRVGVSTDRRGGAGPFRRLHGATPEQQARDTLRRAKSLVETGEVLTTTGQPSGRGPLAEALTTTVTRRLRAWSGS